MIIIKERKINLEIKSIINNIHEVLHIVEREYQAFAIQFHLLLKQFLLDIEINRF